jgi:hypothetical protein
VPTERGRDVIAVAQQLAPEIENQIRRPLGPDRFQALCVDLQAIRRAGENHAADS